MGALRKLDQARLQEILRRQDPPQFGLGYEPAIKPTREEAPSSSRPAPVWAEKLGREVSTLSTPEREVLAIVLHCCLNLFELHEQRMLPFLPSPHPLVGHPLAAGLNLRNSRGTLVIANELHFLKFHPIVFIQCAGGATKTTAPGCLIGDFLLYIADRLGPYCVNLNVKSTRSEFEVPQVGVNIKTNLQRASVKEKARHEIERKVYSDIEIPTIEVAADEIPTILVANLRQIILWQKRKTTLTAETIEMVIDLFNEGLVHEASPLDVINATEISHGIGAYQQKIVLYQAIFSRKLRLDLFESHFFIDKPMQSESQDAVEVFAHWFRRGP